MPDRYQQLVNTPVGRLIAGQVGLPAPPMLERHRPGRPVIEGTVLLGAPAPDPERPPRLAAAARAALDIIGASLMRTGDPALADAGAPLFDPDDPPPAQRFKGLVLDASGLRSAEQLVAAYAFFHATARRVEACGRIVVLGTPPAAAPEPEEAVAQRALEGLVRSLGKEARRGATAQLVYVAPGAEDQLDSPLRFLLSPRSAYVSGQVVRVGRRVGAKADATGLDWGTPLQGKVALVTGAARGIGAAIAEVLSREGAHVVGLDVEPMADDLAAVAGAIGGSSLTADVTAPDAPARIAEHLLAEHGGVDVVVHNAGVTRDKTIGRMTEAQWATVLGINLIAPQRITAELLERDALRRGGRVVCLSSMNGIAGAAGQTNYAASKAGLIGFVEAQAPALAKRGITINAVAPGFIETPMTAAMPFGPREAGRRMNSLSQGGLPVDVAETIAWLAWPASAGVTGNVVRVCGQSLIGA
ncbi:MAG TPA: 3-oxoacyl-ACP reductase [Solirubrobacteraceae bacterium]|nr:3-oxoacyl-ACP reductase [Solirubrobacteraceae bacterium]